MSALTSPEASAHQSLVGLGRGFDRVRRHQDDCECARSGHGRGPYHCQRYVSTRGDKADR